MVRDIEDDSRAQGNLISLLIGVMIAAIVGFQVVIPIINDSIANLTGTQATVANIIPLFVVLMVLLSLASPLMRRM